MNFYKFLKNEESDFKGRSLSDIWNYSDEEIEKPHDFIQLIFPLNKPSRSAFHGYYLDNEEQIEIIKNDENIKNNIIRSSNLEGENLMNVTIYEFDKNNNFVRRIEAKSANISSIRWSLKNVKIINVHVMT